MRGMIKNLAAFILMTQLFLPVFVLATNTAQAEGTGHQVELLQDREYFETLLASIREAKSEIVMAFFLFKTNGYESSYPDRILNELIEAARRGVRIRVILERGDNPKSQVDANNRETALRLKEGGIDISFDNPGRTTHTKVLVIDQRYTLLGSHNLTSSALKYNNEISVLVDSPKIAKETLKYIDTLH